jgi:hypothetical protein
MGDFLVAHDGETVNFEMHVTAAMGGAARWIEDGREVALKTASTIRSEFPFGLGERWPPPLVSRRSSRRRRQAMAVGQSRLYQLGDIKSLLVRT